MFIARYQSHRADIAARQSGCRVKIGCRKGSNRRAETHTITGVTTRFGVSMVSTESSNSTIYLRECGQCGRHRRIEAADSTGADAVGVAGQRAPASRNGCAHMYLCRCWKGWHARWAGHARAAWIPRPRARPAGTPGERVLTKALATPDLGREGGRNPTI
jgi:hypothetical protein